MDTFVESSWYFARYTCPDLQDAPLDLHRAAYWLPVDQYIGGVEHAVLHLLYARFFTKVLRDLGWLSVDEPFENLLTQGMVIKDGAKMSKSRGNVVDPDDLIRRYGADTARLFSLFAAPPEKDLEWSTQGVEGAARFLNRIWKFVEGNKEWLRMEKGAVSRDEIAQPLVALRRATHATVKKVTEDIEQRFHFNTAIAAIMELVNTLMEVTPEAARLSRGRAVVRESLLQLVTLLFPFVPHFANELWEGMGEEGSLDFARWPTFDPDLLKTDEVLVVVQVNGKVRSRIVVPRDQDERELRHRALEDEKVKTYIQGRPVKRVIVVPDKIVNVVV
jgi:leucyl-tRNA synthetase